MVKVIVVFLLVGFIGGFLPWWGALIFFGVSFALAAYLGMFNDSRTDT